MEGEPRTQEVQQGEEEQLEVLEEQEEGPRQHEHLEQPGRPRPQKPSMLRKLETHLTSRKSTNLFR